MTKKIEIAKPFEENAKGDQGDNDIDQSRQDIEQYQLRPNSESVP